MNENLNQLIQDLKAEYIKAVEEDIYIDSDSPLQQKMDRLRVYLEEDIEGDGELLYFDLKFFYEGIYSFDNDVLQGFEVMETLLKLYAK